MDRWLSFSCFGSRKLPRFHRCLSGWRQLTPARSRRAMPAPVWEGIAVQLTFLNQPLRAAFILISLVTYMRPSELLALRNKDRVPPLLPLLPCWSVVIAAFETAVSAKTWSPRWVGPHVPTLASMGQQALAPAEELDIPEATDLEFRFTLQRRTCSKLQPTLWNLSGMTMHRTRHRWIQHRSCVRGFRTLQEVQKRGQWRALQQCRKIRQKQSPGGRPPLFPLSDAPKTSWKHSRDVPRHCW